MSVATLFAPSAITTNYQQNHSYGYHEGNNKLRVVVLYTAYTRDSYSDMAMKKLIQEVYGHASGDIELQDIILPEIINQLPTRETLAHPPTAIAAVGDIIKQADIVLCASPIYNFTYSPYLHLLFHQLRHRFLTTGANGEIVSRNLKGTRFYFLLTGRSNRLKWHLLTRYVMTTQIKFLLSFWGARLLDIGFIPDCHPGHFTKHQDLVMMQTSQLAARLEKRMKCA